MKNQPNKPKGISNSCWQIHLQRSKQTKPKRKKWRVSGLKAGAA